MSRQDLEVFGFNDDVSDISDIAVNIASEYHDRQLQDTNDGVRTSYAYHYEGF